MRINAFSYPVPKIRALILGSEQRAAMMRSGSMFAKVCRSLIWTIPRLVDCWSISSKINLQYCRREISSSGSRHYYTTKDGGRPAFPRFSLTRMIASSHALLVFVWSLVRQVENLEEAREVAREILVKITLGGIKRLFFKTAIAFAGYKTGMRLICVETQLLNLWFLILLLLSFVSLHIRSRKVCFRDSGKKKHHLMFVFGFEV